MTATAGASVVRGAGSDAQLETITVGALRHDEVLVRVVATGDVVDGSEGCPRGSSTSSSRPGGVTGEQHVMPSW